MNDGVTPLGAIGRGLAAGFAGTAAMTGWQLLAARLQSSGGETGDSPPAPQDPWERASAPAKLARLVIEGVFRKDVQASSIGFLTEAMHWGYGTSVGAAYGVLPGTAGRSTLRGGLAFGIGVWASSYAQLVPLGLYQPPWRYPAPVIALDISYHLVYGTGVATAYRLLP